MRIRSRNPGLNQTAFEVDQSQEHLEMQGQSLEERQSCCTSPVVASCSREQRASGSAGAHQYRSDLQVKTDEPATWERMDATEEAMAEPAAEPPDETTEYRDAVRCGSGQIEVDRSSGGVQGASRAIWKTRRGRWQPRRHRPSKFSRPPAEWNPRQYRMQPV